MVELNFPGIYLAVNDHVEWYLLEIVKKKLLELSAITINRPQNILAAHMGPFRTPKLVENENWHHRISQQYFIGINWPGCNASFLRCPMMWKLSWYFKKCVNYVVHDHRAMSSTDDGITMICIYVIPYTLLLNDYMLNVSHLCISVKLYFANQYQYAGRLSVSPRSVTVLFL